MRFAVMLVAVGLWVAGTDSPSSQPAPVASSSPSPGRAVQVSAPVERVAVRAVPTRSRAMQERLLAEFTTYFEPTPVTPAEPTSLTSLALSRCGRHDASWISLLRRQNDLPADAEGVPAGMKVLLPACPYWKIGGSVTIDPGETVSGEVFREMGQWGPGTQSRIADLNEKGLDWAGLETPGTELRLPYTNARISYVLRPAYQGKVAEVAAAVNRSGAVLSAIPDDELRLVSSIESQCAGALPLHPFDDVALADLLASNAQRRRPRMAVVGLIDTGADPVEVNRLFLDEGPDSSEGADKDQDDDGNGFVDDTYGANIDHRRGFPSTGAAYPQRAHGTHVAGLILGGLHTPALNEQVRRRISLRLINIVSESPKLSPANERVTTFGIPLTNLIDAVSYARSDPPIPILNLSVETARKPEVFERAGLGQFLAIVAAGNSGEDIVNEVPYYPAASSQDFPRNVLTVAALQPNGQLAPFSNYGAQAVSLAAPGCAVVSTVPSGGSAPMTGTSQAAPQVTFAAALLYSEGFGIDRVRNRLLASAQPIGDGDTVAYGRLDVVRALSVNDDLVLRKGQDTEMHALIEDPPCLPTRRACLGWDRVLRMRAVGSELVVLSESTAHQPVRQTIPVPEGSLRLQVRGGGLAQIPWTEVADLLPALRR